MGDPEQSKTKTKRKQPAGFFKTTALGALLIVVPFAIVGFALWQLVELVKDLLIPIFESLPLGSVTLRILVMAAAFLSVVLMCYITGLLVRTRWGSRLRHWIERSFLERIPGYKMVRSLAHQYLGEDDERKFRPVLVDLHQTGAKMVGLEIEVIGDGSVAVFFPSVPAVTLGQVQIVPEDRVEPISASLHVALETLTMFGEGASKLVDLDQGPSA